MAVISLLFSSTTTWPRLIWLAVAQALTMWMADLAPALSKLCRRVLPSMATSCPAVTSCSEVIQDEQAPLELGSGLSALKTALKRSCEGMPLDRSRNRAEPGPLLAAPGGDGHEVIGPGDDGTQGDGDDVDERVGDLAAAGVGQAGEVLVDRAERSSDMRGGVPRTSAISVVGPVADITEDHHVSIIPNYPSWRNRPGTASGER